MESVDDGISCSVGRGVASYLYFAHFSMSVTDHTVEYVEIEDNSGKVGGRMYALCAFLPLFLLVCCFIYALLRFVHLSTWRACEVNTTSEFDAARFYSPQ
jgi:hypothetical protein